MQKFDINDAETHMGHIFMECMRRCPDAICQIDAATGETESNSSVLSRSVRLARCFRRLGLRPGDVLALGGNNHLDLHIPLYAALMNGLPIVGVDPLFKYDEIRTLFKLTDPRIAFCQREHYKDYVKAAECLDLQTEVFTFDGENSFADLLAKYGDEDPNIDDFEPAKFDLDKVYTCLMSTGGTTGVLKVAAFKHKAWIKKVLGFTLDFFKKGAEAERTVYKNALNLAPIQWISGFFNAIGMPLRNQTKVQTSAPATAEHVIDVINKYKPVSAILYPSIATSILKHDKKCDFTCFDMLVLTGSKVYKDILTGLKERMREDAVVKELYGQTENLGPVLVTNLKGPLGSCGKRNDTRKVVKLMDPETGNEITEPHTPGELWTKGADFTEYYNDPEETAKAFSEDGWYKTGDILYRDEEDNFYFVERLKMLIKYRNYHVIPPELEEVIRGHAGVLDVSVTCVPDAECGELPVACVVARRAARSALSAQHIKDLVADKLSDCKRLRGGVVFMDQLPLTSAGKVARAKLKQMVLNMQRE